MAENDGIVDGQGQLHDDGNGVGDKGYLPHQVVGAHVQQGRRAEGDQQHRDLRIGAGGQQQHQHNDDDGNDIHHQHLLVNDGLQRVAHLAAEIQVIAGEIVLHPLQARLAFRVVILPDKGHVKEGGGGGVVLGAVVKFYGFHALQLAQAVLQLQGFLIGNVGHHDLGGAEGGKLPLHQVKPLPGLRIVRQVGGNIVADPDPVPGKGTEYGRGGKDEKEYIALIHNDSGHPLHKAALLACFQSDHLKINGLAQYIIPADY